MAQNRNSIRSIKMIKKAYVEILKEKDMSKITVKEVTDLADLTRNTFYAHFKDIEEVNSAIESDIINETVEFMHDVDTGDLLTDSSIYFQRTMDYVDQNKEMLKAFLIHGSATELIQKRSNVIIEKVYSHLKSMNIKDEKGLKIFLSILLTGTMHVIRKYLDGELKSTSHQLANEFNKVYLSCYKNYMEFNEN